MPGPESAAPTVAPNESATASAPSSASSASSGGMSQGGPPARIGGAGMATSSISMSTSDRRHWSAVGPVSTTRANSVSPTVIRRPQIDGSFRGDDVGRGDADSEAGQQFHDAHLCGHRADDRQHDLAGLVRGQCVGGGEAHALEGEAPALRVEFAVDRHPRAHDPVVGNVVGDQLGPDRRHALARTVEADHAAPGHHADDSAGRRCRDGRGSGGVVPADRAERVGREQLENLVGVPGAVGEPERRDVGVGGPAGAGREARAAPPYTSQRGGSSRVKAQLMDPVGISHTSASPSSRRAGWRRRRRRRAVPRPG